MKVFVIFLQDMLMKIKTNLLYKHEYKNKIKPFTFKKMKFQPGT